MRPVSRGGCKVVKNKKSKFVSRKGAKYAKKRSFKKSLCCLKSSLSFPLRPLRLCEKKVYAFS
jgi:hypothetical protein